MAWCKEQAQPPAHVAAQRRDFSPCSSKSCYFVNAVKGGPGGASFTLIKSRNPLRSTRPNPHPTEISALIIPAGKHRR